ncbi:unnamed protein product [Lactuca virosa]|uniref:Uncharacterized protein n=1 Tax=Lactuca virosa TaxID=75947 RepID=A0AAU9PN85_9ASTR|nr:unnamed protein product [Lactuca virosa]
MTSNSRRKSHKKNKHSSREYSDVDEDVKMKEMNASSDDKENGVSIKEYATPSNRRKKKTNGEDEKIDSANLDDKKSKSKSNEFLKLVGESKSISIKKDDIYSANVDESKDDKEPKDNDRRSEREKKNNEWPVEGVRNIELEME